MRGHEEEEEEVGEPSVESVKRKSMSSSESEADASAFELPSIELTAEYAIVSVDAGEDASEASADEDVEVDGDEARLEWLERLR